MSRDIMDIDSQDSAKRRKEMRYIAVDHGRLHDEMVGVQGRRAVRLGLFPTAEYVSRRMLQPIALFLSKHEHGDQTRQLNMLTLGAETEREPRPVLGRMRILPSCLARGSGLYATQARLILSSVTLLFCNDYYVLA